MNKYLLLFILFFFPVAYSFSQQVASATSGAKAGITTPVVVSKSADLVFGTISVSMTNGGTIIINPDGTRTTSGGVHIPTFPPASSGASFTVASQDYTYYISLPTTVLDPKEYDLKVMDIGHFVTNPVINETVNSGTKTIGIGATLTVGPAKSIASEEVVVPFPIIVTYN